MFNKRKIFVHYYYPFHFIITTEVWQCIKEDLLATCCVRCTELLQEREDDLADPQSQGWQSRPLPGDCSSCSGVSLPLRLLEED